MSLTTLVLFCRRHQRHRTPPPACTQGGVRYVVTLPDGSSISLARHDFTVRVSAARRGTMMGLCGSNDKNMTNDLLGPDGLAYGGACPPLPKGWCGVCGVRCAV
jgi:hypothetical protein